MFWPWRSYQIWSFTSLWTVTSYTLIEVWTVQENSYYKCYSDLAHFPFKWRHLKNPHFNWALKAVLPVHFTVLSAPCLFQSPADSYSGYFSVWTESSGAVPVTGTKEELCLTSLVPECLNPWIPRWARLNTKILFSLCKQAWFIFLVLIPCAETLQAPVVC